MTYQNTNNDDISQISNISNSGVEMNNKGLQDQNGSVVSSITFHVNKQTNKTLLQEMKNYFWIGLKIIFLVCVCGLLIYLSYLFFFG